MYTTNWQARDPTSSKPYPNPGSPKCTYYFPSHYPEHPHNTTNPLFLKTPIKPILCGPSSTSHPQLLIPPFALLSNTPAAPSSDFKSSRVHPPYLLLPSLKPKPSTTCISSQKSMLWPSISKRATSSLQIISAFSMRETRFAMREIGSGIWSGCGCEMKSWRGRFLRR